MSDSVPDHGVPRETDELIQELFGERADLARRYADALGTTGMQRGLIGPREVPRLWERHILNCAVVSDLIAPELAVVDVGSGAGLPGLVLAIRRPDLRVTLLEPLLRRVTWLEDVVDELGLDNVTVSRGRAEEAARLGRHYDLATARAVAPLGTLATWCLPLVRAGGELLAIKGDTAAQELTEAEPVISRLGGGAGDIVLCGDGQLETPTTVIRIPMENPPPPPKSKSKKGSGRRRGDRAGRSRS